jgi:chromosome segregation ATPase
VATKFFNVLKANAHIESLEGQIAKLQADLKAATEDTGENTKAAIEAAETLQAEVAACNKIISAQKTEREQLISAHAKEKADFEKKLAEKPSRDALEIVSSTGLKAPISDKPSESPAAPAKPENKLTGIAKVEAAIAAQIKPLVEARS